MIEKNDRKKNYKKMINFEIHLKIIDDTICYGIGYLEVVYKSSREKQTKDNWHTYAEQEIFKNKFIKSAVD